METRADNARAERINQYQSLIVEFSAVKTQVQSLEGALAEQKTLLRDINQKLSK